jgi:WD40 repeat protein
MFILPDQINKPFKAHSFLIYLLVGIGILISASPSSSQVSILLKPGNIFSLAFSPDGQIISSGHGDGKIRSWEVQSEKYLNSIANHTFPVVSIIYSPNGKIIASGGLDKKVKLWETATGKELLTFSDKVKTDDFYNIAFSPDGQTLAIANGKELSLKAVSDGQSLGNFSGHSANISSIAFSIDGKFLATGSADKTVKIWQVSTGKVLHTFQGHTKRVNSISYGPNGEHLASGSADGSIKIWEIKTGKLIRTFDGHTGSVTSIAYSPQGDTLVSGSWDGTIKIWSLDSGNLIHNIQTRQMVNAVTFHPKGNVFASGSTDGIVKLWLTKTGTPFHSYQLPELKTQTESVAIPESSGGWGNELGHAFSNIAIGSFLKFVANWFSSTELEANTINVILDEKVANKKEASDLTRNQVFDKSVNQSVPQTPPTKSSNKTEENEKKGFVSTDKSESLSHEWTNIMLPLDERFVFTQIPKEWPIKPAFDSNIGKVHIIEFIPKGQNLEQWDKMITITSFRKIKATPEQYLIVKYQQLEKICGKADTAAEILRKSTDFVLAIVMCGSIKNDSLKELPPGYEDRQGEIMLYRIFKKGQNIYIVLHSWRGKVFNVKFKDDKTLPVRLKTIKEYTTHSNHTMICNRENPQGPCKAYVDNYVKEMLSAAN